MLTDPQKAIIDAVIAEFVSADRAFTAFEVSLEAQQRGVQARHRHLRDHIHACKALTDITEFGDYEKTLVDVGQGHQAFLYHRFDYDTANYTPLNQTSPPPVSIPPAASAQPAGPAVFSPTPVPTVSDDGSDGGDSNVDPHYQPDYRNRLMVPTKFLRELGLAPGEMATLALDKNTLWLFKDTDPGYPQPQYRQVVERNGDLRLSQSRLVESGLTGNRFEIKTEKYLVKGGSTDGVLGIQITNV